MRPHFHPSPAVPTTNHIMKKKLNNFLILMFLLLAPWAAKGAPHYLNIRAWNFTGCDFGEWGSQNAENMIVLDYNGSRNNGVQGGWPNTVGTYHLFSSNAVAGVYTLYHQCEW